MKLIGSNIEQIAWRAAEIFPFHRDGKGVNFSREWIRMWILILILLFVFRIAEAKGEKQKEGRNLNKCSLKFF